MAESPFPLFDDGLETVVLDDDLADEFAQLVATPFGFTWEFDFAEGDIVLGRAGETLMAAGVASILQWCRHVLTVRRGESPIHSPDTGVDLEGLLGRKIEDGFVIAKIKQEIETALVQHDRIDSVVVDNVITAGDSAYVFVTLTLDTGEVVDDVMGII